ncbi:MAG: hypothetical protein LUI02_04050 [Clostridiales bacterium]|nr:hypothetical protein [Clostridiales bacterium]
MRTLRMKRTALMAIVAFAMCLALMPAKVFAADVSVTLGTTDNASAGDEVTARLVVGDNPGISTFAMQLSYDSDYLTYTGAAWNSSLDTDNDGTFLVTESTEDNVPYLNISAVFNENFESNATLVTLQFTVKEAYDTMPVTLENRDITDSSYVSADVSIVVDATAGLSDAEEVAEEEEVESTEESTEIASSGAQETNDGEVADSESSSALDDTPKTGVIDVRFVLVGALIVLVVVAGLCIRFLGKKRAR